MSNHYYQRPLINTFFMSIYFAAHDEAYVCVNDFLIHCKMARPIDS